MCQRSASWTGAWGIVGSALEELAEGTPGLRGGELLGEARQALRLVADLPLHAGDARVALGELLGVGVALADGPLQRAGRVPGRGGSRRGRGTFLLHGRQRLLELPHPGLERGGRGLGD